MGRGSKRGFGVGFSALVLVAFACTPQPPQAPDESPSDESVAAGARGDQDPRVDEARALTRSIYANPPPSPPKQPTQETATHFTSGPLKAWFQKTSEGVHRVSEYYAQALDDATPEHSSEYALEVAKLYLFLADGLLQTASDAMPVAWRGDAATSEAYVGALRHATAPLYEQARGALDVCLGFAEKHGFDNQVVADCRQTRDKLPKAPDGTVKSVLERSPRVQYSFEAKALRRLGPCEFAGSLHGVYAAVYGDASATEPLGHLRSAHVERVTLPKDAEGRYRLELSWPLSATVYADADDELLRASERIDLVPKHLWLARGAAVSAAPDGKGGALVRAVLKSDTGERAYEAKVSCAKLELYDRVLEVESAPKGAARQERSALLHEAPGGKVLGRVGSSYSHVKILERRGSWLRVTKVPEQGLAFQGFVEARDVREGESEMLGVLKEGGLPPTHETAHPAKLYFAPSESAASLDVAPGVAVAALGIEGDYLQVSIAGFEPDAGGPRWMRVSDLTALK